MNKTIKFILLCMLAVGYPQLVSAEVPADKLELVAKLKKDRGGNALSPKVGKKVQKAFDLYGEEKLQEAIEILEEIDADDDYDKASVARFLGVMYAGIDGKAKTAFKHLKTAVELDILSFDDHAGLLRTLGDFSINDKKYKDAIKYYNDFLAFSYDEDPMIYLRIANSYYELGDMKAVLAPARKSIALYEEPNQGPYTLIYAAFYERKMYKEATKALEDLVKVFPEDGKWWPQLAAFYSLIEDFERSLSTFEVAYKKGYLETEAQIKQLAQMYAANGIPYKAALIQEKYILSGLIKKEEKTFSILASNFIRASEYPKAAIYYGEAAKFNNDADLYRRQGDTYMLAEDYKNASIAYSNSLKAGGKKIGDAYLGLAQAHFNLQNWKESYDAILKALEYKGSKKRAAGWEPYIKSTAERKGTVL